MVSIIIPTYNRSSLLGQTLQSIIEQSFTDWECIVVDDNSSDHTKELMEFYCEKYSSIKFFKRPGFKRKGANSCRNYGLTLCNGCYIKWFDSDDLLHIDALKLQVEHLEKNNIDASISYAIYFDDRGTYQWVAKPKKIESEDAIYDFVVGDLFFSIGGPLWRKEYLLEKGILFNEDLSKLQDTEFHYKHLISGVRYEFSKMPLVMYRRGHNDRITFNFNIENLKSVYNYYLYTFETAICINPSKTKKLQFIILTKLHLLFFEILKKQKNLFYRYKALFCYFDHILLVFGNARMKTYPKIILGNLLAVNFRGRGGRFFKLVKERK